MNYFRSVFKVSKNVKKLVGTDSLGNKYYEIFPATGQRKPRRSVESPLQHTDYLAGEMPSEWEAWMRNKRESPPTTEEISERENLGQVIKIRAIEAERKDKERQQMERNEGLVAGPSPNTKATGHASAPMYQTLQGVEDPSSTGNDFEPASWEPPTKPK